MKDSTQRKIDPGTIAGVDMLYHLSYHVDRTSFLTIQILVNIVINRKLGHERV